MDTEVTTEEVMFTGARQTAAAQGRKLSKRQKAINAKAAATRERNIRAGLTGPEKRARSRAQAKKAAAAATKKKTRKKVPPPPAKKGGRAKKR